MKLKERYFIYVYYFCSTDYVELEVSKKEFDFYVERVSCQFTIDKRFKTIDDTCDCLYYSYLNYLGHNVPFAKIEAYI